MYVKHTFNFKVDMSIATWTSTIYFKVWSSIQLVDLNYEEGPTSENEF